MSTVDGDSNRIPEQLVHQLVKGYDALGAEIRLLDEQRQVLENRLSWAKQQYLDALKRFVPQSASQDFRVFLDELDEAGICEADAGLDWLDCARRSSDSERKARAYNIQHATDAREKISYRQRASDAGHGVKIWTGKSADTLHSGVEMEKDFTSYAGISGRLKCPFVAPRKRTSLANSVAGPNGHPTPRGSSASRGSISGRRSKRSSFHDPIRAEMCGFNPTSSAAPSVEDSAPLCPIRFLDQHSPEEVAKYFETHKHELPRSHEICVKRYQSNEQSIKELDSKYGNLVSMIQGLGQVHQPMLPDTPNNEEDDIDTPDSKDRVQNWVSTSLQGLEDEPDIATEDADRLPHFDRPLKDVRVGESPSRPWGIKVPEVYEDVNGNAARSDHTASPRETPQLRQTEEVPAAKCPFDHKKMNFNDIPHKVPEPEVKAPTLQEPKPSTSESPPPPLPMPNETMSKPLPQMVFNGPVFFGYSMEQTVALLQRSALGKS